MGKVNITKALVDTVATVASGGFYAYGKALDKAAKTGKIGAAAADAIANTGVGGSAITPTVGTKNSLAIQSAVAAGALGAAAGGAGAAGAATGEGAEAAATAPVAANGISGGSIYSSAIGPTAVTGDPLAASVLAPAAASAGAAGAGGAAAAAPGTAPAAAPAATPAAAAGGSNTLSNLAAGSAVAGTGVQAASMLKGSPKMPELPQPPAPPQTESGDTAAQAAAEARVNEQAKRRTQTLLTGGQGAANYGKNSFAPSLLGNNTYLKSVIG